MILTEDPGETLLDVLPCMNGLTPTFPETGRIDMRGVHDLDKDPCAVWNTWKILLNAWTELQEQLT